MKGEHETRSLWREWVDFDEWEAEGVLQLSAETIYWTILKTFCKVWTPVLKDIPECCKISLQNTKKIGAMTTVYVQE